MGPIRSIRLIRDLLLSEPVRISSAATRTRLDSKCFEQIHPGIRIGYKFDQITLS